MNTEPETQRPLRPPVPNECGESFPMSLMKTGQTCVITQVISGGGDIRSRTLRRRLLDMGLIPGTKVCLFKTAPMGDPMELHLRGYDLSLRREDAAGIMVAEAAEAVPESPAQAAPGYTGQPLDCRGCKNCGQHARKRSPDR